MLLADRGYDADWIKATPPGKAFGPIFRQEAIATNDLLQPVSVPRPKSGRAVLQ